MTGPAFSDKIQLVYLTSDSEETMDQQQKQRVTDFIKQRLHSEGFEKVGIAPAKTLDRAAYLKEWLAAGKHGTMRWMENYLEKRLEVTRLYPEAKSVVSVGLNYYTPGIQSDDPQKAKISRYAWGRDYHKVIKKKLKSALTDIREHTTGVDGRLFVDTAPIQDKLWAVEAGLGWQGKNTNILTRDYGSWLFLGEIVLNTELIYDRPMTDFCGSCTTCIDACPTLALTPYKLDARKCISYLTIEMWDRPLPEELAPKMDNWVFGCDICQDVCPWNRFEKPTVHAEFSPLDRTQNPLILALLAMDEVRFKKTYKKSPVYRCKYPNFIRNAKNARKNGEETNR